MIHRSGRTNRWLVVIGALALLGIGVALLVSRRPIADEFVESLPAPTGQLTKLVLSPDGRYAAAGSAQGQVVVTHLASQKVELIESGGVAPLTMLGFASDGLLMSGDRAGQLRAWQPPDFEAVKFGGALETTVTITCAAFGRKDASLQVMLGLADGRIVTLDETGTTARKSGHRGVKALTLSPETGALVSAGTEGRIVWHDLKGERATERHEHQTEVPVLVWSPDGSRLASADWDGEIRIWDAARRKVQIELSQPDAVSGLAWVGDRIVTGSWDGRVRVWQVTDATAAAISEFDTGQPIHALIVEPSGQKILTVANGSAIDVWRLVSQPDTQRVPGDRP